MSSHRPPVMPSAAVAPDVSAAERIATRAALDRYQEIFDTH